MRTPPGALALCALLLPPLAACKDDPPPASGADAGLDGDGGPVFTALELPGLPSPPPNFFDVWGPSYDHIFLVGERGTILHGDGTSWAVEEAPTTEDLRGIWGRTQPDPSGGPPLIEAFAVGNHGVILERSTAGVWTQATSPAGEDLRAVKGRRGGRAKVYAVGVAGTMVSKDLATMGAGWRREAVPTQETMHGLWIDEDGTGGVAVGNLGLVMRLADDGSWARQAIDGLSIPLQGVWGTAPDNLWIVGLDGVILRSNGMAFDELEGAPTFYLRRVVGLGGGEVWITAWGGNLVRVSGEEITVFPGFSDHRLEGIWATIADVPDGDGGILQVPRYYVTGVTGQVLVGP